jgi:hypothetical protein
VPSIDAVRAADPFVAKHVVQELADQRSNVKLIASENYSSLAVQQAMGNIAVTADCPPSTIAHPSQLEAEQTAQGLPHCRGSDSGCAYVTTDDRSRGRCALTKWMPRELATHADAQPHVAVGHIIGPRNVVMSAASRSGSS